MSKKKYYIAYGSNLSVGQMAYRCPDAKVIGTRSLRITRCFLRLRHH